MDLKNCLNKFSDFYLESRKLARTMIQKYVAAHVNHTRVAIITFAQDVEVVFDFISQGDNTTTPGDGTKFQMFAGESPLWENVVFHDENNRATDLKLALQAAKVIMASGRRARESVKQICVVLSDGNIRNGEEHYPYTTAQIMKTEGIKIFTVAVGKWKVSGNVHIVATDPNYHDFYEAWVDMTESIPFAESSGKQ